MNIAPKDRMNDFVSNKFQLRYFVQNDSNTNEHSFIRMYNELGEKKKNFIMRNVLLLDYFRYLLFITN